MAAIPPPRQDSATVTAIYQSYEKSGNKPYNTPRIGAAKAAIECDREVYYSFRWASQPEYFRGQLLRLFRTGHIQETRLVEDLRKAGVKVLDRDESTGKQWELTDETGHIVCRMDAAMTMMPDAPDLWFVGELKTHNDKSFKALLKDGIEKSKPEHFGQCQIGMHFSGMTVSFYLAHNKNTDELWSDVLPYDEPYSVRLVARLHRIIFAEIPPSRISNNPSWHQCQFCDHHAVCHMGKLPQRNCRTCMHSTPQKERGEWKCELHNKLLNRDEQRDGCKMQRYNPNLVPFEQTDMRGDDIVYTMTDGTEWVDDGGDKTGAPF